MTKTLDILMGNSRGKYVLKPFNADLAFVFGEEHNMLYETARYTK